MGGFEPIDSLVDNQHASLPRDLIAVVDFVPMM